MTWIKTQSGSLVNTDCISIITMDEFGKNVKTYQIIGYSKDFDNELYIYEGSKESADRVMKHLEFLLESKPVDATV